jgi:hypothetical protein
MTTVLTRVAISVQYIPSGKGNIFIGNSKIVSQPNHGGQGKIGKKEFSIMLNLLGFFFE